MKLHYLLLYAVVLFFGGCTSGTGPPDTTTIKDIFPLAYGDYWTYNIKYNNNPAYDSVFFNEQITYEIISVHDSDGHQFFEVDNGLPKGTIGSGSFSYYYSGSDVYEIGTSIFSGDTNIFRSSILHFPEYRNTRFDYVDTTYPGGNRSTTYKILYFLNEFVTVPAGTFYCYHYQSVFIMRDSGTAIAVPTFDSYYAVGVGLIKSISYEYLAKNEIASISELLSYRVE